MLAAGGAALLPLPSTAAAKTIELKAVTPWHSDWQENSCILRRGFGSSDDLSVLSLERFGPGDRFQLVIVSDELKFIDRIRRLTLTFGEEAPQDYSDLFHVGTTETGEATIFMTGVILRPPPAEDSEPKFPAAIPPLKAASRM